MRAVQLTPSTRRDLHIIWDFIADDSVEAADRVIATIHSEIQKLAKFPSMGRRHNDLDPVYRVWRTYSYLIVYRPDTDPMQITRVISGYRDLRRLNL